MIEPATTATQSEPPLYDSVAGQSRRFSIGRKRLHQALNDNELEGYKNGSVTLLETAAVIGWIKSRPKYSESPYTPSGYKQGDRKKPAAE